MGRIRSHSSSSNETSSWSIVADANSSSSEINDKNETCGDYFNPMSISGDPHPESLRLELISSSEEKYLDDWEDVQHENFDISSKFVSFFNSSASSNDGSQDLPNNFGSESLSSSADLPIEATFTFLKRPGQRVSFSSSCSSFLFDPSSDSSEEDDSDISSYPSDEPIGFRKWLQNNRLVPPTCDGSHQTSSSVDGTTFDETSDSNFGLFSIPSGQQLANPSSSFNNTYYSAYSSHSLDSQERITPSSSLSSSNISICSPSNYDSSVESSLDSFRPIQDPDKGLFHPNCNNDWSIDRNQASHYKCKIFTISPSVPQSKHQMSPIDKFYRELNLSSKRLENAAFFTIIGIILFGITPLAVFDQIWGFRLLSNFSKSTTELLSSISTATRSGSGQTSDVGPTPHDASTFTASSILAHLAPSLFIQSRRHHKQSSLERFVSSDTDTFQLQYGNNNTQELIAFIETLKHANGLLERRIVEQEMIVLKLQHRLLATRHYLRLLVERHPPWVSNKMQDKLSRNNCSTSILQLRDKQSTIITDNCSTSILQLRDKQSTIITGVSSSLQQTTSFTKNSSTNLEQMKINFTTSSGVSRFSTVYRFPLTSVQMDSWPLQWAGVRKLDFSSNQNIGLPSYYADRESSTNSLVKVSQPCNSSSMKLKQTHRKFSSPGKNVSSNGNNWVFLRAKVRKNLRRISHLENISGDELLWKLEQQLPIGNGHNRRYQSSRRRTHSSCSLDAYKKENSDVDWFERRQLLRGLLRSYQVGCCFRQEHAYPKSGALYVEIIDAPNEGYNNIFAGEMSYRRKMPSNNNWFFRRSAIRKMLRKMNNRSQSHTKSNDSDWVFHRYKARDFLRRRDVSTKMH